MKRFLAAILAIFFISGLSTTNILQPFKTTLSQSLWSSNFSIIKKVNAATYVRGYFRKNGTYVKPHYRSNADGNPYNNYSFPGNTNPYTGKTATGKPDTYLRNYYNKNKLYSPSYNSYSPSYDSYSPSYDGGSFNNGLSDTQFSDYYKVKQESENKLDDTISKIYSDLYKKMAENEARQNADFTDFLSKLGNKPSCPDGAVRLNGKCYSCPAGYTFNMTTIKCDPVIKQNHPEKNLPNFKKEVQKTKNFVQQKVEKLPPPYKINSPLKYGSSGREVIILQSALSSDKNIYPEGIITGFFGKMTKNALITFQKKHGLEETGAMTLRTIKKFHEAFGESPSEKNEGKQEPQTGIRQKVVNWFWSLFR